MRRASDFVDPAPRDGIYRGDLKYGRRYGNQHRPRNDYESQCYDNNGKIVNNEPLVILPYQQKRDPHVWAQRAVDFRTGKPPKHNGNPPQLSDFILKSALVNPSGLIASISTMKLGEAVIRSRRK